MNAIDRPTYLSKMTRLLGNANAKILVGMRRSGKTTLMRLLRDKVDTECVEIDMDLMRNRGIRTETDLYDSIVSSKHEGDLTVFVDEIQLVPGWERAIRSLIKEGGYDIWLTGSNSQTLSSDLSTLMAGRYISIKVQPLNFTECLEFSKDWGLSEKEVFDRYVRLGGLPQIWCTEMEDEDAYSYLRDVYSSIVVNDVSERYSDNREVIERVFLFLGKNVGGLVSLSNMYGALSEENLGINKNTFYQYAEHLENAYIFSRCKAVNINGKELLRPKYKFYVSDLGIRNALVGFDRRNIDRDLENIVYNELSSRGYTIGIGSVGDREVDFVADKNGRRMYIQVTYRLHQDNMGREFGNLEAIRDSNPKYVVTMDDDWYDGESAGVRYMHILVFLKRLDDGTL